MARPPGPDLTGAEGRRLFRVFFEGEAIEAYEPDRYPTVREVAEDLADRWASLLPEGFEERDLVVWRGGRVRAVVRTGEGGVPEVTLFDDIPG
jgi:hypothetical protein